MYIYIQWQYLGTIDYIGHAAPASEQRSLSKESTYTQSGLYIIMSMKKKALHAWTSDDCVHLCAALTSATTFPLQPTVSADANGRATLHEQTTQKLLMYSCNCTTEFSHHALYIQSFRQSHTTIICQPTYSGHRMTIILIHNKKVGISSLNCWLINTLSV